MNTTQTRRNVAARKKVGGFTLIELLVVMSFTLTMLLPAVQSVSEAGRAVATHNAGLNFLMQDGAVQIQQQADDLQALLDSGELDPVAIGDSHAEWIRLDVQMWNVRKQAAEGLARARSPEEREAYNKALSAVDKTLDYIDDVLAQLDLLGAAVSGGR